MKQGFCVSDGGPTSHALPSGEFLCGDCTADYETRGWLDARLCWTDRYFAENHGLPKPSGRHVFEANVVAVEHDPFVIALGDEQPDGLRHSLQIYLDDDHEGLHAFGLTLNDESNACDGTAIASVELGDTFLRIRFRDGARIRGGRDGALSAGTVDGIEVSFRLAGSEFRRLHDALRESTAGGIPFRCDATSSRLLFSVLDSWASFFVSPDGKPFVISLMIERLREALAALPDDLKLRPGYEEVREALARVVDRGEGLTLDNRAPFNVAMFEFLYSLRGDLPEDGRAILRSVERLVRPPHA